MTKYEVTGYTQIPVSVIVEAETPSEAYEKGSQDIFDGLGNNGDTYWQDEFSVWDLDADRPVDYMIGLGELREETNE